jgi:molybdenum cofactor guanylyltransferase
MMGVLGAVLVGGRSSRFGSDKAAALLGDAPLGEHAKRLLAPFADTVVLVGGEALPDLPRPHLGPLGGMAAALDHAASHGFAYVLTIACDMPRLPDGLLDRLVRRAPSFCSDAPVLGFWPAALGAHLLAHIEGAPDRSARRWAQAVGALPIAAGGPLPNVNTREDLALL